MSLKGSQIYQGIVTLDRELVQRAMDSGEDIDVRDTDGCTFLHTAVETCTDSEIVKILMEKQTSISERNEEGRTFLDFSSNRKYLREIEELFVNFLTEKLLDIKYAHKLVDDGWTYWPIKQLAKCDHIKSNEDLVTFLKDVPRLYMKTTKLHEAIVNGNQAEVENRVCTDRQVARVRDITGLAAIHKATLFKRKELVKFLLSQAPDDVNLKDNMKRTALHYAAMIRGDQDMFNIVKMAGGQEYEPDVSGRTAVDYLEDEADDLTDDEQDRVRKILTDSKSFQLKLNQRDFENAFIIKEPKVSPGQQGQIQRGLPTTQDALYIANTVGPALTEAMVEISLVKPQDPVEYLAHFLYRYAYSCREQEQIRNENKSLKELVENHHNERQVENERKTEEIQIMNEEIKRQQKIKEQEEKAAEEERQRKLKESSYLVTPSLDTITEVNEVLKECDELGETELHKAVSTKDGNVEDILKSGCPISSRNHDMLTARDMAVYNNDVAALNVLDNYIRDLFTKKNIPELYKLILEGYGASIEEALSGISDSDTLIDVQAFILKLSEMQEKIRKIFLATKTENIGDLKTLLDSKQLAVTKDENDLTPLHYAVLLGNSEMVAMLIQDFPDTIRLVDNINRTPLHYAMALSDNLAEMLMDNGAEQVSKDAKKRLPTDFQNPENANEIIEKRDKFKRQQTNDGQNQLITSAEKSREVAISGTSNVADPVEMPHEPDIVDDSQTTDNNGGKIVELSDAKK